MRRSSAALAIVAFALSASCNSPEAPPPSIAATTFASSLGIDLSKMTITSDSLYYEDLVVGTGELVKPGTTITIKYQGWLPDGTLFDASSAHGGSFQFTPDLPEDTRDIQGWQEGIPGMAVGGTRLLIIPPALGYDGATFGPVPPNAILVYQIQVISAP